MERTIMIEADYAASADAVWRNVLQYRALSDAMAHEATYDGLPDGDAQVGDAFDVIIRFKDWRPKQVWHIRVVERDDAARRLRSQEHGGLVRSWAHTLTVTQRTEGGCRYRDKVVINAGWLTPLVAAAARTMYLKRHLARKALLENLP